MDALAFGDALRHLDNALALVSEDDRRFELRSTQARALRGAGRVDDALAVLDDELGRTDDADRQFTLRLQRVQLLNDQYRAAEGLDDVERLVVALTGDPDQEIEVQLAKGRAYYIMSLDNPGTAEVSRDAYEAAYAAAKAQGDKASMARALLPTTWFTDYWADYRDTATANVAEALELAEELGDEDLILDAMSASMHRGGTGANPQGPEAILRGSEAILERLEERRDPVRLNAHCFWMMWQNLSWGRFDAAVAMCDRGIQLADLIGSEPVQYGSIKAIALTEAGRFDEVDAAIAQEVTDDEHPFGQAMASLARSVFLTRIGAWGPALDLAPAVLDVGFFGEWHRGLTGAQVALAEGDTARAIELAGPACPADGTMANADHVRALDVVAQSQLMLGDVAAALDAADRALAIAEPMGFGVLTWQLRRVRGLALEELGDPAADAALAAAAVEFETLADRIADPDLRTWFEGQALAPTS